MKRGNKEDWLNKNFVICDCGYCNNKRAVDYFGDCICCHKVLNERAYFKHQLIEKLKFKRGGYKNLAPKWY